MFEEDDVMLNKILEHKRDEIAQAKKKYDISVLKDFAAEQSAARGFGNSLKQRVATGNVAVIAELKRASPSKGMLRENFDPVQIATGFMRAGACCLSILTDVRFFKGSGAVLDLVRRHCMLPALRKDFIVDPYQVYESRALGADCILLIIAALPDDGLLQELTAVAYQLGMDVLFEVHGEAELDRILTLDDKVELIGINNRNLSTFDVSLETSIDLVAKISRDKLVISESGIRTPADIATLKNHNIHAYLIGESLMRADDPATALRELIVPQKALAT